MATEDLAKLKIHKESTPSFRRPGRKRVVRVGAVLLALMVLAVLLARGFFARSVEVSTATVSQVYPSQAFTRLNASGYVVAQRKAAVAAKITGRLEWLGVEEGNRVREGQILARLENRDTQANRDQATANLDNALANVEQARTELKDASLAFNRQKELVSQGIVARAEFDAAEARYNKGKAAVDGAQHQVKSARAALRNAEVNVDFQFSEIFSCH